MFEDWNQVILYDLVHLYDLIFIYVLELTQLKQQRKWGREQIEAVECFKYPHNLTRYGTQSWRKVNISASKAFINGIIPHLILQLLMSTNYIVITIFFGQYYRRMIILLLVSEKHFMIDFLRGIFRQS